jgi:hypothetical protein
MGLWTGLSGFLARFVRFLHKFFPHKGQHGQFQDRIVRQLDRNGNGAGGGNRTPIISLEGCGSASTNSFTRKILQISMLQISYKFFPKISRETGNYLPEI